MDNRYKQQINKNKSINIDFYHSFAHNRYNFLTLMVNEYHHGMGFDQMITPKELQKWAGLLLIKIRN